MSTTVWPMTAEELLAMPKDGFRYELLKGELKKMSPAGFDHGAVGMSLSMLLAQYVKAHNLGVVCMAKTGFKIAANPDTVLAPDVSFVRRQRIPQSGRPKAFWPGAPDLAVEVVSPGDTKREVAEKVQDWLKAGSDAVWVVNPKNRTVTIHRPQTEAITLGENDELDGQTVVPGFRCLVAEIFAD
jgi:Uma2 family endonuclease